MTEYYRENSTGKIVKNPVLSVGGGFHYVTNEEGEITRNLFNFKRDYTLQKNHLASFLALNAWITTLVLILLSILLFTFLLFAVSLWFAIPYFFYLIFIGYALIDYNLLTRIELKVFKYFNNQTNEPTWID